MPFDLGDPGLLFREDVLADPRPLYEELRRRAPIWEVPGRGTFLVSDPGLVREAVGRTDEFSSNMVSMVHRASDGAVGSIDVLPYRDPNNVLAVADPPDHTRHRKLLQAHLSPAAVAGIEPAVRAFTSGRLAPMVAAGGGDAVPQLADVVPAATICHVLGMRTDDAETLLPVVLAVGALLDGMSDGVGMERGGAAALDLAAYALAHLRSQRNLPPEDRAPLLDALVSGIDDGTVAEAEAVGMLMQLFSAGTETTQSLIATTIERLAVDLELQAALRADPSRIPDALEHVLRDDGPFQFHYRWTPDETVLGSTVIPARSRVLLLWAAANLPVDDHGDRLPPHFAFGRGIHFCIGAALARLEARVVVEELLGSAPPFALDPVRPPRRRPSIMLRRHASLPIVFSS